MLGSQSFINLRNIVHYYLTFYLGGSFMAKASLDRKLVSISWALFLIMIGGLWMVPAEQVPESAWLLGVGIIFLGLNAARKFYGLKVSLITVILGIVALACGVSGLYGVVFPVLPVLLIILGASILLDNFSKGSSDCGCGCSGGECK